MNDYMNDYGTEVDLMNDYMNDYGTEVDLLAVTGPTEEFRDKLDNMGPCSGPVGEAIIEYAGRLCWDTQDKLATVPGRIQKWIGIGHESMIEHASATFYIRASRVLTHELVRHRLASYSQRSQRYVKESEPRYITPPEIWGTELDVIFTDVMKLAWSTYNELLMQGIRPEIARYVLPNACETQIIFTANFRELRHFIKLRTSPRALPEMREVAGKVRDICKEIAPGVFADV